MHGQQNIKVRLCIVKYRIYIVVKNKTGYVHVVCYMQLIHTL